MIIRNLAYKCKDAWIPMNDIFGGGDIILMILICKNAHYDYERLHQHSDTLRYNGPSREKITLTGN